MLKESLVERIGFGGGKLSTMPTLKSALYILEAAYDNGIHYFDTAPLYGSGYSEKIIGKFSEKKRNNIFITTKVGLNPAKEYNLSPLVALPLNYLKRKIKKTTNDPESNYDPTTLPYRLITKEYIKTSFEKSLRNLRTDYIDYYLLHEAIPSFLDDNAIDYLITLKSKGYISKLGLAASYINYLGLDKNTIELWDVLQYESSPNGESNIVYDLFPDQEHILHGTFKSQKTPDHILPIQNRAGYVLMEILKKTKVDRVLFSTSRLSNLYSNIQSFNLYS
jgi:aryl-alcohol dehydrogenase-like predicted oxidoreductase